MRSLGIAPCAAACLLASLALCVGAPAASAHARVSPVSPASSLPAVSRSVPSPALVAVPLMAPPTLSLSGFVCGLAKLPVNKAAGKLIGMMAEARFAVLSATLVTSVAKPWCEKGVSGLASVFKAAVRKKPAIKPRIGPFAFQLRATALGSSQGWVRESVTWTEFDLTTPLRDYYLWGRVGTGAWQRVSKIVDVPRRSLVQFAVRIDNVDGVSSPFTYSPVYSTP